MEEAAKTGCRSTAVLLGYCDQEASDAVARTPYARSRKVRPPAVQLPTKPNRHRPALRPEHPELRCHRASSGLGTTRTPAALAAERPRYVRHQQDVRYAPAPTPPGPNP